ncbi:MULTISPECIES: CBS domain-containing protein [unclassified Sinorhizobium]|uniref:CBS domain-containing protein n=1 Tax=unclassified Sinorhizobium TaxID=2613772 RepID=UPI003525AFFA
MRVSEIMSRDVHLAKPQETIQQVAQEMAEQNLGFMPVTDGDRLIGSVTDRDLVVRALAGGLGADTKVREVMTSDVKYCFEDEEIDDVARNMGDIQVRRLPVVSRDKRLVGVISLADAARNDSASAGRGLKGVTRPGGEHAH